MELPWTSKGHRKERAIPMPWGARARAHGRVHLAESPPRWPSVSRHVLGCKTTTTKGDEDVRTRVPRASAGGQGGAWPPPAAAPLLRSQQPPPGPTLLFHQPPSRHHLHSKASLGKG